VNEFVEECRREWKRLRVPDPVADEMAADLAADLQEAEAEGASAEEVLGSGALDPRAFAAAWAAERGVARRPPSTKRVINRALLLAAIAALVALAITGAVLTIVGSPSGPPRLAPPLAPPATSRVVLGPRSVWVLPPDMKSSDGDTRTAGIVLLIVGVAGIIPLTLIWLLRSTSRAPRIEAGRR
jgi:hypothetical protein